MKDKKQTCVICEQEFTGWGNNPEPIATANLISFLRNKEGNCCNDCNELVVIPYRLYLIQLDKSIQDNKERKLNKLISNKKYLCPDTSLKL
tara:strand:- start:487 stop:759 length:273 start_codon:yes stop_codon:yes gene_type:complete